MKNKLSHKKEPPDKDPSDEDPPDEDPSDKDKYKTIKIPLKKIIKNKNNSNNDIKLFDAVKRTHHLTINVYQILRLWLLEKYHNDEQIPIITKDIIGMAYRSLMCKEPCGRKRELARS